jgi:hypothetical protein
MVAFLYEIITLVIIQCRYYNIHIPNFFRGEIMKVIICIEKSNGMMFNNRRHSKDVALQQKIFDIIGDKKLFVNEYTAGQFENTEQLEISADFLNKATDDDYCFIENEVVPMEKISELLIFQWNRDYPSDFYFEADPKVLGFKKIKTENFAGNSHKKITLEVFKR